LRRPDVAYYGIIHFILFSQQIGDKEIARKQNIIKALDYLSAKIGELNINLPQDLDYHHVVINRAMDVRSAALLFLSSHIKHDNTLFGTPGRFIGLILHTD
jgi:hypothetical protein